MKSKSRWKTIKNKDGKEFKGKGKEIVSVNLMRLMQQANQKRKLRERQQARKGGA